MMLAEGLLLEGKYRIERLIASGGMGDVYLAVNVRLGKRVAVKVLRSDLAQLDVLRERFEREAQAASTIGSAHIADVYDLGELPTHQPFMVMEYLHGESLGARLARVRTLEPETLAKITLEILEALIAAHDAGIVHRDLKPDNIFLVRRDRDDFAKVLDFGVSKHGSVPPTARQTAAGVLIGTPMYMSPEQARGRVNEIDRRSDVYAVGVIMYEATAGVPPFADDDNSMDVVFRVALHDPTPLEVLVPDVDPALAKIVRTAMEKSPAERFQTAEEMRDAVLAWQAQLAASGGRASSTSLVPAKPRKTSDNVTAIDRSGARPRAPGELPKLVAKTATPVDTAKMCAFEVEPPAPPRPRRRRWPGRGWLVAPALAASILAVDPRLASGLRSWAEAGISVASAAIAPPAIEDAELGQEQPPPPAEVELPVLGVPEIAIAPASDRADAGNEDAR
jgi:serine/threonine-protein kinase